MSIKCGRCGNYHESVTAVRSCYNGSATVAATPPAYAGSARATDKQVKFLTSLMADHGVILAEEANPANIEKRTASVLIDNIIQRNKARQAGRTIPGLHPDFRIVASPKPVTNGNGNGQAEREPFPKVPHGYYATPSATGTNDLDFWFAKVPEDGRWKGYCFIKRVVGGGLHGTKTLQITKGEGYKAAKAIIANGIDKSGNAYADAMDRCRRCNRELTDQDSRARRYGPDCAAIIGLI